MDVFILGLFIGIGLVLLWQSLMARAHGASDGGSAPEQGAGTEEPPPPNAAPGPYGPPFITEAFLSRVLELRDRVGNGPRVWRPDDLTSIAPFRELVEMFAKAEVETEMLFEFAGSEDAILCWAALVALSRRPGDAAAEDRLLARVNAFHVWSRHFLLRTLEAWRPDDPTLAGRVLVRIDDSWARDEMSGTLEAFLRRRAATAAPTFDGVQIPAGFDDTDLLSVLRRLMDPAVARPWLTLLGHGDDAAGTGETGGAEALASDASLPPMLAARTPLAEIGRLSAPGTLRESHALPTPSADVALERAHASLVAEPPRPVLIVGEPGVGKSALVRRLAARLSAEDWTIFEASATQINAGMSFTGALEERVRVLRRGLARPRTLWIVPDFHHLLWSGRHSQSPIGLLEMILPAIEAGQLLVVGEMRPQALERVLSERQEVGRMFDVVRLAPVPDAEITGLLDAWAVRAAEARKIEVPAALSGEAAALARQYLSAHAPPGGVLRLLEGALEDAVLRVAGGGTPSLTMDDLVSALARLTGLPFDLLDERRTLDLESVRARFGSRVIGQPEAVSRLVERLALLKAGVTDPTRPTGVFLFAGPSGTGKTELAKTLADYLFGSPERLVRLDMSELQDTGALERVMGTGAALDVGGHSLAERVRRQPFCVVLLDEFEKAHPRVWDLFLQVFDDGRLTDSRGETTDFRQAIIILTSNVGTVSAGEVRVGLVGESDGLGPGTIMRAVERAFRPELRNRLDQVIVFRALTRDVMRSILRKELSDAFARRGLRRREWAVELEESAIELLIDRGFSTSLGARPLKRAVEQLLLTPLAAAIVDRRAPEGDQFLFVRADGDGLAVEFVDPDAPAVAPVDGASGTLGAGEVGSIAFEARGTPEEVERLRGALEMLEARVASGTWRSAKERLLLESAEPGFWAREDRFEKLGRTEYLDRIERGLGNAKSLLDRISGNPAAPRQSYPRDVVRRIAQRLYLLGAAADEALETGPRDAFLAVEPQLDDHLTAGAARKFAQRLVQMYTGWARERGMRLAALETPKVDRDAGGRHLLAMAGFAAYTLLQAEEGLHVLEWTEPGGRTARVTARVRVALQPPTPARDGTAGLLRQAAEALAAGAPPTTQVARRYREGAAPLVRDSARGWRTGRIDRVLAGDFDLIPERE